MTPILAGMINDSGKRQETMLVEVVAVDSKLWLVDVILFIYPFPEVCFRCLFGAKFASEISCLFNNLTSSSDSPRRISVKKQGGFALTSGEACRVA
jgi:hypothetical protein